MPPAIARALISSSVLLLIACAQAQPTTVEQPATPPARPEAAEQPAPNETPVTGLSFPYVTRHHGVFNGTPVDYTATVAALEVADADGKPGATIVSTAYLADPRAGGPLRPVMFVFNGGPIAPSAYLHMGAFGPRRVVFPDDLEADVASAPLADNPYSILDVCDLVYFDPAGTGFSRAAPGKALSDYFSVQADAQETAAFIAAWLRTNGRERSPVYIFGESYGTNRAAETAGQLTGLDPPVLLAGVVLFGQAVNIIEYSQRPSNIMSYVVSLPTLAALGWYHHSVDAGGADLESWVAEAWQYAQHDYLEALFQGNRLPPEQLRQVAERLHAFTGLRPEVFVDKRLRVSKELYRVELFKSGHKVIGRADGRYVGDAPEEGERGGDPSGALPGRLAAAFKEYLVAELGVPSADQYVMDSPVRGLEGWQWGGASPFAWYQYGDAITKLMDANPAARVMVAAGYYDTMTTWGASQYLVDQEAWPRDRVSLKGYPGGHMAYSIDATARAMADDLRSLVTTR